MSGWPQSKVCVGVVKIRRSYLRVWNLTHVFSFSSWKAKWLYRNFCTTKFWSQQRQPFATKILKNAISSHFKQENPSKPLVLMLHGPTGVGKNHIANILAEAMFQKGKYSRYVNYISSNYHFQGNKYFCLKKFLRPF